MSGHDAKYFTTTKKGEIHELKEELNSQYKDKKKDAVKKVIAAMTVGKDVSMLFTDVVNCMQTDNLELKKLVYLYLINYAKSHPDLAILAVNTFVKVWLSCGRGPLSYTSPFRSMYASTGCSGTCINLDTSL
jgi:AP-1 complex subunit beta-1